MIINKLFKRGLSLLLVLMMCAGMLSLNVFAAESNPSCGLDEHQHTDACYETQLTDTLICGQDETEGHTHSDACYETQVSKTEEQVLTCTEDHTHTEDCYKTETTLICGKEEHTHTAECFAAKVNEEEVSAEVQAFVEAAAALPNPDEITAENYDAVYGKLIDLMDMYREMPDAIAVSNEVDDAYNVALMLWIECFMNPSQTPETLDTKENLKVIDVGAGVNGWSSMGGTFASYLSGHDWDRWVYQGGNPSYWNGVENTDYVKQWPGWAVFASNGKVMYCIEPGVPFRSGQNFSSTVSESNNIWNSICGSADQNKMKKVLGLILQYGYQGNISEQWHQNAVAGTAAQNSDLLKCVATQLLVWETVGCQRNLDTFAYQQPNGSYKPVMDTCFGTEHPLRNAILASGSWYNTIAKQVQDALNPPEASVTLNESNNWTATVDLGDFSASNNDISISPSNKVTATVSGSKLKITATEKSDLNNISITLTGKENRQELLVWDDGGSYGSYDGANDQSTITYSGTPVTFSVQKKVHVTVEAPVTGSLKVTKSITSNGYTGTENGTFTFTITGPNSYSKEIQIQGTGSTTIDKLPSGTYTITEKNTGAAVNYNVPDRQQITVTAGQTKEVTVTNTRKTGELKITKTVTGASSNDTNKSFDFTVTLTGANKTYTVTGATNAKQNGNVITFSLKNQQTAIIQGIPYGVTYTVTEAGSKTYTSSGVVSSSETFAQASKTVTVNNKMNYGSLEVKKTVNSPDSSDKTAPFQFDIELKDENGSLLNGTFDGVTFTNGKATITVKGNESKTIRYIPAGSTYTVTEQSNAKYDAVQPITGTIATDTTAQAAFTNQRSLTSLTVTKSVTYNDQQSQTPSNPNEKFTIEVQFGDGSAVPAAGAPNQYVENGKYSFQLANGENGTITGIPTGVSYMVTETGTYQGYTWTKIYYEGNGTQASQSTTFSGTANGQNVVVENRYFKTVLIDVTVQKDWGSTPSDYMPASVSVALKGGPTALADQDGKAIDRNATLAGESWSSTWEDLPAYEAENKPYAYSVEEVSVHYSDEQQLPAGCAVDNDGKPDSDGIIRVRNTANTAQQDGKNEIVGGWVVQSSTVQSQNGTITLTNNWRGYNELGTASFTIEKLDSQTNKPIEGVEFSLYNANEDPVSGSPFQTDADGKINIVGLVEGTYTLVETAVPDAYKDVQNEDGSDENVGREWKLTFVKDASHKDKLLSVEEKNEDGILGENTWSWNASVGDSTGSITIYNKVIMGQISVTKKLDLDGVTKGIDGDPADKKFTFEVYAVDVPYSDLKEGDLVATLEVKMGETATTESLRYGTYMVKEVGDTELTDYDWQFVTYEEIQPVESETDVSDSSDNTTDILNAVVELSVQTLSDNTVSEPEDITDGESVTNPNPGIEIKVGEHDKTYAVTAANHYERHVGELSITKTVAGNLGDRNKEWNFTVALTSPEKYVNLLNPAYQYTYTITTKDAQGNDVPEYVCQLDDEGSPLLDKDGNPMPEMDEDGNPIVKVYQLEQVIEEDEDEAEAGEAETAPETNVEEQVSDSFESELPNEAEETDETSAEPVLEATYTLTLKHGQTAHITGIPVGSTYKVTEAEANKDGYSTSATGDDGVIVKDGVETKFYNTRYSTPTTNLTVNKVWDDEGHEENRPSSIQVQLYRNGTAYGALVTLDESNGWSHHWTGLSTISTWTAEEINVPDGYTVSTEQSGTVVTITNTYEENEDEEDEDEEELDDPDVPLSDLPDEPDDSDDSDDPDDSDEFDEDFDEPDVPLSDLPDMPEEELDDPDVPLADMPDEPEEEELGEPDVPLADMPDEPEVELEDSDVPLADIPQTGDRSGLWYALTAASAAGLLALTAAERKKREEDN